MSKADRTHARQSADYLSGRLFMLAMTRKLTDGSTIENRAHYDAVESIIGDHATRRVEDY